MRFQALNQYGCWELLRLSQFCNEIPFEISQQFKLQFLLQLLAISVAIKGLFVTSTVWGFKPP